MKKFIFGLAIALVLASASSASAYTYTRDLTIGASGADVVALQDMLVAGGYLVMPAGVSKGYYGALTQSAVAKWQAAVGIAPAAGYFGPISRAKASAAVVTTPSTPAVSGLNGGDGDFKSFKILGTPSSEDVFEGDSEKVLGFSFEANDSDLMVERITLLASSTSGTITKPWKVLEEIAIYNGSEKVADIDASDSDNWEEESTDNTYSIKINNIDSVVEDGDLAKFYVEVTAQELESADTGTWAISVSKSNSVRALNAEGIDVYEDDATKKSFTLKVAEAGDMSISVDDNDNEARTVSVDDDNDTNDEAAYLAVVKSKTGTNNVEKVVVTLTGSDTLTDIIDTVYLLIDGDEVASESAAATVTFDDLDFDIEEDDKIDFEIRYDLNDTNDGARYSNGATTTVTGMTVYYVDQNDDDANVATVVAGGIMTYSTSSVMVEVASAPSKESPLASDESKGKVYVSFSVVAPDDEDIYIPKGATTSTAVASGKGVYFSVVDQDGTAATATTTAGTNELSLVSGGSESGSYWKIAAGNTAKFNLGVILDNNGGTAAKTLGIELDGINFNVGSAATADEQYTSGLDEKYRSSTVYLLTSNTQN